MIPWWGLTISWCHIAGCSLFVHVLSFSEWVLHPQGRAKVVPKRNVYFLLSLLSTNLFFFLWDTFSVFVSPLSFAASSGTKTIKYQSFLSFLSLIYIHTYLQCIYCAFVAARGSVSSWFRNPLDEVWCKSCFTDIQRSKSTTEYRNVEEIGAKHRADWRRTKKTNEAGNEKSRKPVILKRSNLRHNLACCCASSSTTTAIITVSRT